MEEAPPYSPTAATNERGRLPHNYRHDSGNDDEVDPLSSLRRMSRSKTNPTAPPQDSPNANPSTEHRPRPIHFDTAPTFLELPPDYQPIDALAQSFRLGAPLIYANKTPRYHLMQEFTKSGRPRKLHIRRLMASESRSLSLPSSSLQESPDRMRYDPDSTMYTISSYEMHGLRSSTLSGSIRLESGKTVFGGKWTKIWHLTKSKTRDSLNAENEARMQKYGYKADEEWDKRLLFFIRRGIWEDADGRHVAFEDDGEEGTCFEILGQTLGPRKDLLVSCWIYRVWMTEGLRWENDDRGW